MWPLAVECWRDDGQKKVPFRYLKEEELGYFCVNVGALAISTDCCTGAPWERKMSQYFAGPYYPN